MICYRVESETPYGTKNEPFLFCMKCGSGIISPRYKYCPYCGHLFKEPCAIRHIKNEEFRKLLKGDDNDEQRSD